MWCVLLYIELIHTMFFLHMAITCTCFYLSTDDLLSVSGACLLQPVRTEQHVTGNSEPEAKVFAGHTLVLGGSW